ncbi:MAG: DUF7691 family protein [Polyangiales bacterium]
MGYEITALLIDEDRVRAFYGCRDQAQVEAVIARFPERSADLEGAVHALAFAEIDFTNETDAHRHRYAMALVCEHLGERLEPAIRLSPSGIAKAKELERLLSPGLIPMPISRAGDFPVVGFLGRQQIARKLGSLTHEQLANPSTIRPVPQWLVWPKPLETERATYVSWLQRAAEKKRDLVVFYH